MAGALVRCFAGLAVAALVSASSAAPVQNIAEPDIVVIAQLKRIRADFRARGTILTGCYIRVSSGMPSVDRLMCSFLRTCLSEGHTGQKRATECVNARLAGLEAAAVERDRAIPGDAPSPASPDAGSAPEGGAVEIKGSPVSPRPGLWLFTDYRQLRDRSSGRHSVPKETVFQWRRCVAPGSTAHEVLRFIEPPPGAPNGGKVPLECLRWNITRSGDRLSGRQHCVYGAHDLRQTGTLRGSLTAGSLTVVRETHSISRLSRFEMHAELSAAREGECPVDS